MSNAQNTKKTGKNQTTSSNAGASQQAGSSHNPGSTSLQNQPTAYAWVHQSGQPAGSQTQYPHQTQFRPVVTPGGVLPAGYGGTPGGSGLGAGPGGVQGQINFGSGGPVQASGWANNSQPAGAGQQFHNPQGFTFVQSTASSGQPGATQSTSAPGGNRQVFYSDPFVQSRGGGRPTNRGTAKPHRGRQG